MAEKSPWARSPLDLATSNLSAVNCPHCGYSSDRATSISLLARTPNPGNYLICFGCLAINFFDDNMNLRPANEAEQLAIDSDKNIKEIIDIIKKIKTKRQL